MAASRQPAGTSAAPDRAVQLDEPGGDRRAQRRGHPAGRDGRLSQRFRADDDHGDRLVHAVAADTPAVPPRAEACHLRRQREHAAGLGGLGRVLINQQKAAATQMSGIKPNPA